MTLSSHMPATVATSVQSAREDPLGQSRIVLRPLRKVDRDELREAAAQAPLPRTQDDHERAAHKSRRQEGGADHRQGRVPEPVREGRTVCRSGDDPEFRRLVAAFRRPRDAVDLHLHHDALTRAGEGPVTQDIPVRELGAERCEDPGEVGRRAGLRVVAACTGREFAKRAGLEVLRPQADGIDGDVRSGGPLDESAGKHPARRVGSVGEQNDCGAVDLRASQELKCVGDTVVQSRTHMSGRRRCEGGIDGCRIGREWKHCCDLAVESEDGELLSRLPLGRERPCRRHRGLQRGAAHAVARIDGEYDAQ